MKNLHSTTLKGLAAAALLLTASAASAQFSASSVLQRLGVQNVDSSGPMSRAPAPTSGGVVWYTGQGLNSNPDGGGGYDLNLEICGVENGADAAGPYLLWVFTATNATSATITGPWGTVAMTKMSSGTFKYVSGWYPPATLLPGVVSAVSTGGKPKNSQLVISHGCRPYTHGAWCSPGFWKNADKVAPPNAWTLIGSSKADMFNLTVVPNYYDTASLADPSLGTVLGTPGANTFGSASAPYGLNAFNATGAYLTSRIPGYTFTLESYLLGNESDTCPLDHHGNFKTPQ
jgi:hypothetical protein